MKKRTWEDYYGKDPTSFHSSKYPFINTLPWQEQQQFLCDNGSTWGQNCSSLKKAWKGLKIARMTGNEVELLYYMSLVNEIQDVLGINKTYFPELAGIEEY